MVLPAVEAIAVNVLRRDRFGFRWQTLEPGRSILYLSKEPIDGLTVILPP